MPDHIHGIVVIEKGILSDSDRGVACNARTESIQYHARTKSISCNASTNNRYSNISPKKGSLSTIIRSFKSACTKNIRKYDPDFQWHRSFHDHIIRNEESLQKIRKYIHFNVEKWQDDLEHPHNFV